MSTIVVCQQPSGVKASLQRSLSAIPAARMNAKPVERSRLYFLLAWLHAVVQERLRYTPFGWTKAYEFSSSDQRVGLDAIDIWLVRLPATLCRVATGVPLTFQWVFFFFSFFFFRCSCPFLPTCRRV